MAHGLDITRIGVGVEQGLVLTLLFLLARLLFLAPPLFGGSLGEVYGAKIAKIIDFATTTGCPLIGIDDLQSELIEAIEAELALTEGLPEASA